MFLIFDVKVVIFWQLANFFLHYFLLEMLKNKYLTSACF